MGIKTFFSKTANGVKNNAPLALTILGLGTAAATVFFAVKEVPKVKLAMADKKTEKEEAIRAKLPEDKKDVELDVHLSAAEKIAIIFKLTWPAIISAVATVGCHVGSQVASGKKLKAARTSADLAEKALTEYMTSSVKKLGAKKAAEVQEDIAKKAIEEHPVPTDKHGNIIASGRGDVLIYDAMMEQYFWSSIDKINRAVNAVNAQILEGEFVTINEFYDEIGENIKHVTLGDDLGFGVGVDESGKEAFVRQTFIPRINEDNEVYIVLHYICKDRRTYKIYRPREEFDD